MLMLIYLSVSGGRGCRQWSIFSPFLTSSPFVLYCFTSFVSPFNHSTSFTESSKLLNHNSKFTPKHFPSYALNILEAMCLLKTLQKCLIFILCLLTLFSLIDQMRLIDKIPSFFLSLNFQSRLEINRALVLHFFFFLNLKSQCMLTTTYVGGYWPWTVWLDLLVWSSLYHWAFVVKHFCNDLQCFLPDFSRNDNYRTCKILGSGELYCSTDKW